MASIQSTNNVCSKNEKTINARRLFNGSGMELHLKTKPIITIGGSQKGLLWLQLLFVNISHQWRLFLNRLADVDSEVLLKILNRDWTLTLNVKRCYFSSFGKVTFAWNYFGRVWISHNSVHKLGTTYPAEFFLPFLTIFSSSTNFSLFMKN